MCRKRGVSALPKHEHNQTRDDQHGSAQSGQQQRVSAVANVNPSKKVRTTVGSPLADHVPSVDEEISFSQSGAASHRSLVSSALPRPSLLRAEEAARNPKEPPSSGRRGRPTTESAAALRLWPGPLCLY